MKKDELHIEYLKSGISINTNTGCSLCCKYCIVDEFSDGIDFKFSPKQVVEELCAFPLYNETAPIFINNRTDPLLPNVKKNTFTLLKMLDEKKLPNPKIIVSKLLVGEKWFEFLYNSKTPIFLFRTFSGMPSDIEKTSSFHHFEHIAMENQILQNVPNLYHVHYWRPIIPGINNQSETIYNIMNIAKDAFNCSVISGIRLTNNLYDTLVNFGADLSGWNGDTNHKYLQQDIYENILEQRDKLSSSYKIFRNTSCAISASLGKSDYNLNFYKGRFCANCENLETCKMHKAKRIESTDIFGNIYYYINNEQEIVINSPILQEQISFIKHKFGLSVRANNILKNKSEMLLEQGKHR